VRRAAIRPRHLRECGHSQIGAAHVTPAEAIVARIEQPPSALDLIEGEAQDLLRSLAWLLCEQLGDLGRLLAGEHLGEQGCEGLAATHEITTKLGQRGEIEAHDAI
jgi:hypothetical protein